jgi:hypothetical protein
MCPCNLVLIFSIFHLGHATAHVEKVAELDLNFCDAKRQNGGNHCENRDAEINRNVFGLHAKRNEGNI